MLKIPQFFFMVDCLVFMSDVVIFFRIYRFSCQLLQWFLGLDFRGSNAHTVEKN